jgi:HSP20 family molecular chaperone IbpA
MDESFFTQYEWHLSAVGRLRPGAAWQPAMDLYRCRGGWLLKFELAGVHAEDIQVQLDSQGVRVSGTRLDRRPFEFQEAHLMEIAYSRFERFVALPEPVAGLQFRVEFHDGMLYVHVLQGGEELHR